MGNGGGAQVALGGCDENGNRTLRLVSVVEPSSPTDQIQWLLDGQPLGPAMSPGEYEADVAGDGEAHLLELRVISPEGVPSDTAEIEFPICGARVTGHIRSVDLAERQEDGSLPIRLVSHIEPESVEALVQWKVDGTPIDGPMPAGTHTAMLALPGGSYNIELEVLEPTGAQGDTEQIEFPGPQVSARIVVLDADNHLETATEPDTDGITPDQGDIATAQPIPPNGDNNPQLSTQETARHPMCQTSATMGAKGCIDTDNTGTPIPQRPSHNSTGTAENIEISEKAPDDGADGADGKSAYELAHDEGVIATAESLQPDGDNNPQLSTQETAGHPMCETSATMGAKGCIDTDNTGSLDLAKSPDVGGISPDQGDIATAQALTPDGDNNPQLSTQETTGFPCQTTDTMGTKGCIDNNGGDTPIPQGPSHTTTKSNDDIEITSKEPDQGGIATAQALTPDGDNNDTQADPGSTWDCTTDTASKCEPQRTFKYEKLPRDEHCIELMDVEDPELCFEGTENGSNGADNDGDTPIPQGPSHNATKSNTEIIISEKAPDQGADGVDGKDAFEVAHDEGAIAAEESLTPDGDEQPLASESTKGMDSIRANSCEPDVGDIAARQALTPDGDSNDAQLSTQETADHPMCQTTDHGGFAGCVDNDLLEGVTEPEIGGISPDQGDIATAQALTPNGDNKDAQLSTQETADHPMCETDGDTPIPQGPSHNSTVSNTEIIISEKAPDEGNIATAASLTPDGDNNDRAQSDQGTTYLCTSIRVTKCGPDYEGIARPELLDAPIPDGIAPDLGDIATAQALTPDGDNNNDTQADPGSTWDCTTDTASKCEPRPGEFKYEKLPRDEHCIDFMDAVDDSGPICFPTPGSTAPGTNNNNDGDTPIPQGPSLNGTISNTEIIISEKAPDEGDIATAQQLTPNGDNNPQLSTQETADHPMCQTTDHGGFAGCVDNDILEGVTEPEIGGISPDQGDIATAQALTPDGDNNDTQADPGSTWDCTTDTASQGGKMKNHIKSKNQLKSKNHVKKEMKRRKKVNKA